MRPDLIRDLFLHLDRDGSLQIGSCNTTTNHTLERLPIPLNLKRTLQWNWMRSGGSVGKYTLYGINAVLQHDDFQSLFQDSMIPIGHALNGDLLVLRFTKDKCAVGLVSHDLLWEENTSPDEAYVETSSIEEYLWRAAEGLFLPTDYYTASDLAELRYEKSKKGDYH